MNRGFDYEERIDHEGEGRTLLDHLTSRYRHSDARAWAERIREGSVRVDGSEEAIDLKRRPVEDLLGLDFEQFSRAVLLPQGEFRKLLVKKLFQHYTPVQ